MKLLTEFVGSFLFMFVISLTPSSGSPVGAVAIGLALTAMVYMGGHLSGAHYNPAVSLALLLRKKMPSSDLLPYWGAQIAGGILAFTVGRYATNQTIILAPSPNVEVGRALVVETIFTMMLALTVLNVATHRRTAGTWFYGLAIGFVIVAAATVGGPISGGAFNPAVAIGAITTDALMNAGSWQNLWIYLVGPFLGAFLASVVFALQEGTTSGEA